MVWDATWEEVFKKQDWGKYPGESLIRFIARNFYNKNRNEIKILEIGCGTGANLWYIAREGFNAYGIDGSPTAIEKAKKYLNSENLKAELIIGDIEKLDFENNFFDAVIDVECLCCNSEKDTKNILKEVNRVLKSSGLLFSRTFSDEMYIGKTREQISELEYNNISDGPLAGKGFIRLSNIDSINKIYGEFFDIISIDKLDATFYNREIKVSEWIIECKKKEG